MTTTLGVVLAAVFTLLGIAKLVPVPATREAADLLGYTTEQYRVIGTLEIAGALGVAIGLKRGSRGISTVLGARRNATRCGGHTSVREAPRLDGPGVVQLLNASTRSLAARSAAKKLLLDGMFIPSPAFGLPRWITREREPHAK
jgi:hypothetical protein